MTAEVSIKYNGRKLLASSIASYHFLVVYPLCAEVIPILNLTYTNFNWIKIRTKAFCLYSTNLSDRSICKEIIQWVKQYCSFPAVMWSHCSEERALSFEKVNLLELLMPIEFITDVTIFPLLGIWCWSVKFHTLIKCQVYVYLYSFVALPSTIIPLHSSVVQDSIKDGLICAA